MLAVAFGIVWVGYAVGFHAWTLWQGYDITFLESVNPFNVYQWPQGGPPQIPSSQIFPSKSSSKAK